MSRVTLFRYNPPSVKPAQIIDGILAIAFPDALTALDMTPGRGHFWGKSPRVGVTRSEHDFRRLPYRDGEFDVAVFDPPHNADMGKRSIMRSYGTYAKGELRRVIELGACESMRVGRLGAIIKVTDQTHDTRFQHEAGWVVNVLGVPYDETHGMHRPVKDPKWKEPACSIYSNGSTYLIYRHGDQRHIRRHVNAVGQASA